MAQKMVLRADAGPFIGTGHVLRCLALAQGWQTRGGHVTLVGAIDSELLRTRIKTEGIAFIPIEASLSRERDLAATISILNGLGHSSGASRPWVVLDGYHLDGSYQKGIKEAGYPLLVIDDYGHSAHYHADIVVNQNVYARASLYANREAETRLLLGPSYVLLRKEFRSWQGALRSIVGPVRTILITLGGADPDNLTLTIIKAFTLLDKKDLTVTVVIGASNPHSNSIEEELANAPFRSHLQRAVDNMPELMAAADLCISAGGTTAYELAFMGTPTALLSIADNQRAVSEGMSKAGIMADLGWHDHVTPDTVAGAIQGLMDNTTERMKMALRGQALVDGMGWKRVTGAMVTHGIKLRETKETDCAMIWNWANDPDVRALSFSQSPIPWDTHVEWFASKLKNPDCFFRIGLDSPGTAIGMVRMDKEDDGWAVSVIVDRAFRGQDFGSALITLASRDFFMASETRIIHAFVKDENKASKRAFLTAGFTEEGIRVVKGQTVTRFSLARERKE